MYLVYQGILQKNPLEELPQKGQTIEPLWEPVCQAMA